jgi:hypothetical protein
LIGRSFEAVGLPSDAEKRLRVRESGGGRVGESEPPGRFLILMVACHVPDPPPRRELTEIYLPFYIVWAQGRQ